MTEASGGRGPCHGFRVIEFATMVSGPYCGQMLADMGAEVIKLEPAEGDALRAVRPEYKGLSALFAHTNRGKKSIGIEFKSARGAELVRDLVRSADVVLENFRPGVMDRLGFGYEALREINPRIVYVSITGFGPDGPYANRPAYDQVIQSLTGFMWTQGQHKEPEAIRSPVVDRISAVTAANAVLAALLYRERRGEGQHVSVTLLDAYAALILPGLTNNQTFLDADLEHYTPRSLFQPVATKDGHVMGYVQTNPQFAACIKAFHREDLTTDPRFKDPRSRLTNVAELWQELAKGAQDLTTREIMDVAVAEGVPLAPVARVAEFLDDPQAIHNQTFVDFEDPVYGRIKQLNFPIRFERSPANPHARAPRLGEHTDAVLEGLGLSRQSIADLRTAKTVW